MKGDVWEHTRISSHYDRYNRSRVTKGKARKDCGGSAFLRFTARLFQPENLFRDESRNRWLTPLSLNPRDSSFSFSFPFPFFLPSLFDTFSQAPKLFSRASFRFLNDEWQLITKQPHSSRRSTVEKVILPVYSAKSSVFLERHHEFYPLFRSTLGKLSSLRPRDFTGKYSSIVIASGDFRDLEWASRVLFREQSTTFGSTLNGGALWNRALYDKNICKAAVPTRAVLLINHRFLLASVHFVFHRRKIFFTFPLTLLVPNFGFHLFSRAYTFSFLSILCFSADMHYLAINQKHQLQLYFLIVVLKKR